MSINIQIKGNLETQVNKAYNKLLLKKLVSDKNTFIFTCIENAIDELYKNKAIQ